MRGSPVIGHLPRRHTLSLTRSPSNNQHLLLLRDAFPVRAFFLTICFGCATVKICFWICRQTIDQRNNLNRTVKKYESGALGQPFQHKIRTRLQVPAPKDQNAKIVKSPKKRDPSFPQKPGMAHPRLLFQSFTQTRSA